MKLELPWPPTVNHYWIERAVRTKSGHHRVMKCLGSKGRIFRGAVIDYVRNGDFYSLEGCRLAVSIELYPPDKRKRDIDNVVKPILDALQHAKLFEDDNMVDRLSVRRLEKVAGGKAIVNIFIIPDGHIYELED